MDQFKKSMKRYAIGLAKSLIFPVGMYLIFMVISLCMGKTSYVSSLAFDYIFRNSVYTTIMALAIAIPLSGGRWDFATGTVAILGGIIGGNLASMWNLNAFGMLLLTMIICVLLELLEQCVYILLRISNMIVSLGFVMVYEALTGILFNGEGVNIVATNRNLVVLNSAPWCYLILIVVGVVIYFLMEKTKFGYDTKSLGENSSLAVDSGVKEKKNIVLTAVLVGCLLGIAGVLTISKSSVIPQSNLSSTSLMFSAMGPVLIGLFLSKYTNLPIGVFLGAIGMNAMSYGMVVLGLSSSLQQIFLGVFIVLFMAFTSNSVLFSNLFKRVLTDIKTFGFKKNKESE